MKKILCILLTLTLLFSTSALAMNKERFLSEPNNADMAGSIIYGLNDIASRAGTGKMGNLMVMLYSSIAVDKTNYPVLVMMFGADTFVATSAQIETDNAIYTLMSTGNIGLMGGATINGICNILTTDDMVEVYRDIVNSKNVKIMLLDANGKYDFNLTEAQKHQLSLVVAEFDEEIAKYLDSNGSDYNAKLHELYKLAGPSIAVSRK